MTTPDHVHTITLTEDELSNVVAALLVLAMRGVHPAYALTAIAVCEQVDRSILQQVMASGGRTPRED